MPWERCSRDILILVVYVIVNLFSLDLIGKLNFGYILKCFYGRDVASGLWLGEKGVRGEQEEGVWRLSRLGFVPLHLFIFPRYCNTAGVKLPTTFLLRSLIPHSNRGCNLTMSQLPCVKAVDETVCMCIFKYKQKPNPNKHKSQFRSLPWSWITMWLFKL